MQSLKNVKELIMTHETKSIFLGKVKQILEHQKCNLFPSFLR